MSAPQPVDLSDPLFAFEDIIDGYFPLQTSLAQMMDRLGVARAVVELRHAPILRVPGLAPTAPVPLAMQAGEAGQITHMALYLHRRGDGLTLSGQGDWHWFAQTAQERCFDPHTRLAEPAYVTGFTFDPVPHVAARSGTSRRARRVPLQAGMSPDQVQTQFGAQRVLGPFADQAGICAIRSAPLQGQAGADSWIIAVCDNNP